MADKEQSLIVLDSWEGGYTNNPLDPGGETYCGISRRNWPNWAGWAVIDSKKLQGPIHHNTKFPELDNLVSDFYLDNFWNKQSFSQLDNQDICDKIFQHYVNMGVMAIKFAQRVVGTTSIREDGKMGELTVGGINNDVPEFFLNRYMDDLEQYYENILAQHPWMESFRHEWMLRAKTIGKRPS